jgi:hypothetical protein
MMSYYFSGITDVEAYHNPNEGRIIINDNFRKMISGVTDSVNSISGSTGSTGSTDSTLIDSLSGRSYVKGYTFEKNVGNTITLGAGNGKLLFTNNSNIVSGTSGADFSQIDFSSPFYYYESTIYLSDGTKRYISFDSNTGNTATISNIYLNTNYENPTGSVWTGSTGEHYFIPYFTSDVTGELSLSYGYSTVASGNYSFAGGERTTAQGSSSHAEGYNTLAFGASSHAEGSYTNAHGGGSHAEGSYTNASGNSAHAEGTFTTTYGNFSHAEGSNTVASGASSHAEGQQTIANGSSSHAEGYLTTANGISSHAEGQQTLSSGLSSHAEGSSTIASSNASHAEGYQTTASGLYSHSEGSNTFAIGNVSHSQGSSTVAKGNYSFASGQGFDNSNRVSASGSSAFAHFRITNPYGDLGATADYSAILGGTNHNIDAGANSSIILGGSQNYINSSSAQSAIIGGSNITATTSNTTYVPNLNINVTPQSGSTSDQILVRSTDGSVKTINQPQYVEYRANLTQSSTNAPSATTLGDVTLTGGSWSYLSVGSYLFTKTGAFSAATKVEVGIESAQVYAYTMSNSGFALMSAAVYNDDAIEVRTSYWGAYPNTASGGTSQTVITPGANGSAASDAMYNDILNNTRFFVKIWS